MVHGAGGLDELTPAGENLVAEVRDGEVATCDGRSPRVRRRAGHARKTCGGGDASDNAAIIRTVFAARRGPRRGGGGC